MCDPSWACVNTIVSLWPTLHKFRLFCTRSRRRTTGSNGSRHVRLRLKHLRRGWYRPQSWVCHGTKANLSWLRMSPSMPLDRSFLRYKTMKRGLSRTTASCIRDPRLIIVQVAMSCWRLLSLSVSFDRTFLGAGSEFGRITRRFGTSTKRQT